MRDINALRYPFHKVRQRTDSHTGRAVSVALDADQCSKGAMEIEDLTIGAHRLWQGETPWDGPLAFVDLDRSHSVPDAIALPACPVIGVGDTRHPLAAHLDAVIEPPIGADTIARQALAAPRAAAAVVDVLRLLPTLEAEAGLIVESLAYAMLQGSSEHLRWLDSRSPEPAGAEGVVAMTREDNRLTITLDRPASGNAIDRSMRDSLYEALALAAADPGIAAIDLRGRGRVFSLGADLTEFGVTTNPATAHAIRRRTLPAQMAARCADRLHAYVQGACVGAGLEIAAFARRLTAKPDAWFHLPELAMGILPGAGGCVSLTRRIGRQRTALMILSGKRVNARQALAWGLVDEIVDHAPADPGGAHVG